MTTLPRPYVLLAEIARCASVTHLPRHEILEHVQELAIELWRAGQTEKRAMDTYEYDPPLWCKGMFVEDVTRAVGVPTVPASDPAKDYGRGRTIR